MVTTLRNAIAQGRVAHAYLFTGPRGVGKTTTARILARALDCERGVSPEPCGECATCREMLDGTSLDLIEMDAASHRRIEDIRDLRSGVFNATARARFRVYIVDEVHMLTTEAFNALLKVLEEPPPHVKFILCTTDPQKIPETVRSRCQRLDFRRVTVPAVMARLRQIASQERLAVTDDALRAIAVHAQGGLRDAEVLLEQLSVYCTGEITAEQVRALTGAIDESKLAGLVEAAAAARAREVLEIADAIMEAGSDPGELAEQLLAHVRSALALAVCGEQSPVVRARGIELDSARRSAAAFSKEELMYAAAILQAARREAKASSQPRVVVELALLRLSRLKELVNLEELASRARELWREPAPARDEVRTTAAGGSPQNRTDATGTAPRPGGLAPQPTEPAEGDAPAPEELPQAPPPPPPGEPLKLKDVAERWKWIVASVTAQSAPVGAFLREGEPVGVEGDSLLVGFSARHAFHRESLSDPRRLEVVETTASKLLGRPVKVRLQARAERQVSRNGTVPGKEPAEAAALKDPGIRRLLEKTGGSVVEVTAGRTRRDAAQGLDEAGSP